MRTGAYRIARVMSMIAGIGIFLMMLLTVLDVLGKYILNQPVPGVAEIVASYLMISAVFLPLADAEAKDESITVELLYDRLGEYGRKVCLIIGIVMTLAFYGVLAWQNVHVALDSYDIQEFVSGAWDVVIWPSKFLIPVGLAITIVILLKKLWSTVRASMHRKVEEAELA